MDASDVGKPRAILHADIGKLEIPQIRDAFVAGNRHLILNAAAKVH